MSQCFLRSMKCDGNDSKPPAVKEKVMAYEEKTVGSTPFFKCEACPYMALAEDDIKFHLFTVHPELAKTNGLADNIHIQCPGCTDVFETEETLRTHLRNHHKMGIKDVKKMIKSLVQIALKNAKLKKENNDTSQSANTQSVDIKVPQVFEIVSDANSANGLPKAVAFISVDELQKMSTPNFENVDPKEIIQEASINIVYTNEVSTQYVNVAEDGTSNSPCNVIQVSNVPPDLISSIQPRIQTTDSAKIPQPQREAETITPPHIRQEELREQSDSQQKPVKELGTMCSIAGCQIRLRDENNLSYHRKSHQSGKLICQECMKTFLNVDSLHSHLWKVHTIDLELPTCEICGFKTYKKHRLHNIHMKIHGKLKLCLCPICSKSFKNANQLSKHKLTHKKDTSPLKCPICPREFSNGRQLREHVTAVHEKLKPYKCQHCDYTAARKGEMKLHMRSHTGDKPYSCNICSYRSADHNAMRRHKKMHSKEGVYKCKHCPYTSIQSTSFAYHMMSRHPKLSSIELHRCPYCSFKSINKDKYVTHLTNHADKEGVQLLLEMAKGMKSNKLSWTIPSETEKNVQENDEGLNDASKTVNEIPIEVYDCDSLSEGIPQDYSKNYCATATNEVEPSSYDTQTLGSHVNKEDNNSDCIISESSNDTVVNRHQYVPQHLQISFENNDSNLHFLNPSVSLEQSILQDNNVNSLAPITLANDLSNNIMSNFPIRLPIIPQSSQTNNIMLKPVNKISLPPTKVTGPIIKPTQILPVPVLSNSPVNMSIDEGAPRKKPKISVKSNLILKGPDQVNMFHSQQKMAFRRLEDNERYGLGGPVTFNNLITTQFMLPPQSNLGEPATDMMSYPQEGLMSDSTPTPSDSGIAEDSQMFSFNSPINVNSINMLQTSEKIQNSDPSYIKLEATIKQNTQSPSLERMCNANILNNPAMTREYKASPPLEDIHKNMNEIKNEVKSDSFYNIALNTTAVNPPIIEQFLIDNIMGEQYSGHMDLPNTLIQDLPELEDDVIEIDDNSDDNKLLPRFDMNNFHLESLCSMHNDYHFLESESGPNKVPADLTVADMNRMVQEVPIINQKDNSKIPNDVANGDFVYFIQGKNDPMMNTSVRQTTNKINVKNIELMKN